MAALGLPGAIAVLGGAVPITLQTLGVMLVGSLLGARKGALSLLLFLVLVAIGLPLLAGGRGGLGVFAGPSVGCLVAWPIAAWVIGRIVEAGRPGYRWPRGLTANLLKLSNSAYYGLRRSVGSAREALVLMGNRTVVTLAFAASMGRWSR